MASIPDDSGEPASARPNFSALRVAAFESRRAEEMTRLIERFGGTASVSPSMREVPMGDWQEAVDFAHRVMAGQIDIVIFMTGTGVRHLVDTVERRVDRQRFLHALTDMPTVARGPKPVAVLKELGVEPRYRAAEPNTWRELLETLDQNLRVANQVVAILEYGLPNPSLVAGLEARGAQVLQIRVYQWALPEDIGPLCANARAWANGEIDVAMFTSSQQVVHLFEVAEELGIADELRRQAARLVVASIGPTTSETLRNYGLPVDVEPTHSKMGHLVSAAATHAAELLQLKRVRAQTLSAVPRAAPPSTHEPWHDSLFMRACRLEACPRPPIWLMRQAGRYMREYREVRAKVGFLELCKNPALCAEVMITAVNRLGVDAAIIFADLLPILEPLGFELEFAAGEGPVIHNPVRDPSDLGRVYELESIDSLSFVVETVRQTRAGLPPAVPLIGFAGAPFTLASYAIEGGSSRHYLHTKTLMYRDPGAWHALLARISRAVARLLEAQIDAGAQAVQLFDSWVGCLSPDDYRQFVLPHSRSVIAAMPQGVPVIHFATGNPALLPLLAEAGGTVIGVDWRVDLAAAWQTVGHDLAVQGNLEPALLLAPEDRMRRAAEEVLRAGSRGPGHIFNLGHGILPQTPVDNVLRLIEIVQRWDSAAGRSK